MLLCIFEGGVFVGGGESGSRRNPYCAHMKKRKIFRRRRRLCHTLLQRVPDVAVLKNCQLAIRIQKMKISGLARYIYSTIARYCITNPISFFTVFIFLRAGVFFLSPHSSIPDDVIFRRFLHLTSAPCLIIVCLSAPLSLFCSFARSPYSFLFQWLWSFLQSNFGRGGRKRNGILRKLGLAFAYFRLCFATLSTQL